MIEFENHKKNIDVLDKYNWKNYNVDKSLICYGQTAQIDKSKKQEPHVPSLASCVVGLNNTAAPLPTKSVFYQTWTDIDTHELYLNSKPTCFLILSKPGIGAFTLGEALSKKLNCFHLCPKNLIVDELEQKSPCGKTVDFNMRHNKVCKFNYIISILKNKLESPAVKHRGYVISGLPLISTLRHNLFLFDSLYSEDSVLYIQELLLDIIENINKKEINKKVLSPNTSLDVEEEEEAEHEEEEHLNEEEDQPVKMPKSLLNTSSGIFVSEKAYYNTKKTVLTKQFNELLELIMPPDIILYITCPDKDVLTKKSHKYLDYASDLYTIKPFESNATSELRWPPKHSINNYMPPYDHHVINSKYYCRPPMNYSNMSTEQLCNYKKYILPLVEAQLKRFHPKHIFKLDGRTSNQALVHDILNRMQLLKVDPVLIPEPLYLESPPDDIEEFWSLIEDLNVIQSDNLSFKRFASPWLNRCPVELKNRKSVMGKAKYAVSFLNHIFLLSSLTSMVNFCQNPRPYLQIKYLEPTCRIIVVGTKSSGKSMISNCLSWVFNAVIINFGSLVETERQIKYDKYAQRIFSEIIPSIEDKRINIHQNKEFERIANLDKWIENVVNDLKKYISFLVIKLSVIAKQKPVGTELLKNLHNMENKLSFLPMLDDLEECKRAVQNKHILIQFAPLTLITTTESPKTPVIGDEDVTEAINTYITSNELQKEMEPTPEEIMMVLIKNLSEIDSKVQEKTDSKYLYGKWIIDGFSSNPEFWEYLVDSKLLPDYTISIVDNREMTPELAHHYWCIENIPLKNYQERYMLADDPLISVIKEIKRPTYESFIDLEIIKNDILMNVFSEVDETIMDEPPTEYAQNLSETIGAYSEDWENVKVKLEDNNKACIEVEIEEKSDVQILEEVLQKIRNSYYFKCVLLEDEEENEDLPKSQATYNDKRNLCETNIYCPVTFYEYQLLWPGKPEFRLKYNNKLHYFSKEDHMERFQKDPSKYQYYINPFKNIPFIKICVIGCIGSGKSSVSKFIAKELGLLHIDFSEFINEYFVPKHFKKIGRKYENIFTDEAIVEEAVADFQIDEENSTLENILSNEKEFRQIIFNYFEHGLPLPSILLQKILKKLWFEPPFVTNGFVLDGFPKLPSDVEVMISCVSIPDLIIELEIDSEVALNRLSTEMFKAWKKQLDEAKKKAKLRLNMKKKQWNEIVTKTTISKLIIDELIELVIPNPESDLIKEFSQHSNIIDSHPSGSIQIDSHVLNTYNQVVQDYPEPTDDSVWEQLEDAHERIDSRIESIFGTDEENIQLLKDTIDEQKLKLITVDGTKPLNKVQRIVLIKLSRTRNRCESFFEQTYLLNSDVAEMLLLEGLYFKSKFNTMCPVYIYENPNTIINPFNTFKIKDKIFPVAHRSFIYFCAGEEALIKFRKNPLIYICHESINSFLEYPLRFGVIGPPKSGKSTLASKLSKQLGLLCLSRGTAIRHVLENFSWTELASSMLKYLSIGKPIEIDLIMEAIHIATIDHRSMTYGFVFDGFPDSPVEGSKLMTEARRVPVPDERFDYLCEFHKPASKVPAFLNVVDIAGLVRGAAEGQGLGNAFLSHIKACDAIFNLCRAFDDEDVIHVDGEVNPVRDLETIGEELRLKDEEQLMQAWDKLDKVVARGGDKKLKPEYDSLTRIKAILVDEKKHIRFGDWSAADIEVLNKHLFLTSKPALYLVNLSEKDYTRKKNKWLPKLKEWIDKNDPGAPLIPFSGVLEAKLQEMDPEERKAYLKEHNITSALEKIIVQGYKALNLEYFFTAGPDEVKAWTIQKGTKAPQAAGRIHTDFEKGFIMAEVMHFKDFKEEGTEAACKAAGKYRQQGRNYVVEDGDIIFFKFNAGAGLKDAKKK